MNDLQRLLDIEAIKQLKYRYMRCIDQKLWDELEECFVEDVTCAYSGGQYSFEGIEDVMDFLVGSMGRPTFISSHRVHQPEIVLTSDIAATGIWALEDYVIDLEHDCRLRGACFYYDQYVKIDGEWKIQHTGYERTFEETEPNKGRDIRLLQNYWADEL